MTDLRTVVGPTVGWNIGASNSGAGQVVFDASVDVTHLLFRPHGNNDLTELQPRLWRVSDQALLGSGPTFVAGSVAGVENVAPFSAPVRCIAGVPYRLGFYGLVGQCTIRVADTFSPSADGITMTLATAVYAVAGDAYPGSLSTSSYGLGVGARVTLAPTRTHQLML